MAFLPSLTRRLQRAHTRLFQPLFGLHHATLLPSSSSCLEHPSLQWFCHALHRTSLVPSPEIHCFSTLESFSAQNLHDPFGFDNFKSQTVHEPKDPGLLRFLELLRGVSDCPSEAEAMAFLDDSGIEASTGMVYSAIWETREEWRLAFLAFKWGEKWGCSDEKASHLMIWVLGNHRKFNTAWCLIRDMHLHPSKMDARRAMFIMVDRYAYANDPCKAIHTFHIMEKFGMTPDQEAFHAVLNALCRHGNVEEAEEFMFANKKLFPLETEGFNIILNGWCNISPDVLEAKRVWREMSKCCITPDATSYTHMISCFSKVGNLFDSLRLYDEMKKRGWVPGLEVYNSLVYVLTHQNCFKEALNILEKMKGLGLQPDSATYNSMIRPLCEAKRIEEARYILATMMKENLSPTTETYHAFLEAAGFEGTFELLNRMRKFGLGPTGDTFLIVVGKFFNLQQPENAMKIFMEMKQYEVVPSSTHYSVLVQGLAKCGWLIKAKEIYAEMIEKGFLEDLKLKKLLKEPVQGTKYKGRRHVQQGTRDGRMKHKKGGTMRRVNRNHQSRKTKSTDPLSSKTS